MTVPVTRTKITVPRPRLDLLSRPRLLILLDDILDYPLTLVSAPAGYGKTSLLIDLASQAEYPVAWFSIDSLDRDFIRFLYHLVAAINSPFPEFGSRTFSIIDNHSTTPIDLDQMVRVLVNDIYDNISEHFAVILDDFHLASDNQQLTDFLNRFSQDMGDNCHLIISSRTKFNLPDMPLFVGRSEVLGIDFEDLAFNSEEFQDLLRNKYQQTLENDESKSLVTKTEGWVTGLLLSFETNLINMHDQSRAANVTGVNLFNYLAQQVFDKQPKDIQDFLLMSSFLNEFNAEICSQVFNDGSKKTRYSKTISQIMQNNLFVQSLETDRTWFRYHQLFQDFLQTYYQSSQPKETFNLLSRLLTFHIDNKDWEKAYAVAKKLDDPITTAKLIDQASSALFHGGRVDLLSEWLNTLPESGFEAYPRLYAVQGFASTALGNLKLGLIQLNHAMANENIISNFQILAQTYTWRSEIFRLLGQYSNALDDGLYAIKITNKLDSSRAEAEREVGLAYFRSGNISKAIESLQRSLSIYISLDDHNNAALVYLNLGLGNLYLGQLDVAENYYSQALNHWIKNNNNGKQVSIRNNLGVLYLLQGDYFKAHNYIERAYTLAKRDYNRNKEALSIASQGDIASDLQLFKIAKGCYIKARSLSSRFHDKHLLLYTELCLSSINRKCNNRRIAKKHLNSARVLLNQMPSKVELGIYYRENGILFSDEGKSKRAAICFSKALVVFKEINNCIEIAKTYLSMANCSIENKNIEKGNKYLHKSLNSLPKIGLITSIVPDAYFFRRNIGLLTDNECDDNDLLYFSDKLEIYSTNLSIIQEELYSTQFNNNGNNDSLYIKAFGNMEVLREGVLIDDPEWTQQKTVRELFYYLLSSNQKLSKEQIGLIFWPECTSKQLTTRFKNSIYRLRKALGAKYIIYDKTSRTYYFNREENYQYDIEDFVNSYTSAQVENNPIIRFEKYQDAISKYNHPFGKDLDGVWAEPIRINLYLKFEKALLDIAKFNLDQKNFNDCITNCQKIIEIEPTHEKAWMLIFEAYSGLGDRNE